MGVGGHDDNERTTARHSIVITNAPYMDNDRSASRYASKARDDFARLVEDLESGAFGADVLVLWENSRYSRRTSEWLHLMELIATNLGGGNEDEIYVVPRNECHLWGDPNASKFIRAEQPQVASLGVLLVAYPYFGHTFQRYASGAMSEVGGTGLVTPVF